MHLLCLKLYLTEPFDGSVMICSQLELYLVVVLFTCLTEYDVNEKFEKNSLEIVCCFFSLVIIKLYVRTHPSFLLK